MGKFCISLDFELMWGVHDSRSIATYGENILGARLAIPQMLDIFVEFDIACTWATVGMLFARNKNELISYAPKKLPNYSNSALSNYSYLSECGDNEQDDPYHYGNSLIKRISETPRQEIASHTYSHFYCMENGPSIEDFYNDTNAFTAIASAYGVEAKSFVFPRNQFSLNHGKILADAGYISVRGNEKAWGYQAGGSTTTNRLQRVYRLVDTYLPLAGHCADRESLVEDNQILVNIASSRLLRPVSSKLSWLEGVRLSRIKRQMSQAAQKNGTFHLWWHPHNFGIKREANLQFLRFILEHYALLNKQYGMRSMSMADIARTYADG